MKNVGTSEFLVLGIPLSPEQFEGARAAIGDDILQQIEIGMGLQSHKDEFRQEILTHVDRYISESKYLATKPKKLERKHLQKLAKHSSDLSKLINSASSDQDIFSAMMRIMGRAYDKRYHNPPTELGQPLGGLGSIGTISAMLAEFSTLASECSKEESPYYSKNFLAERFVCALICTYSHFIGSRPKVTTDSEKRRYSGPFFDMTDKLLTKLGHRQQNTARGSMIAELLTKF